MKKFAEVVFEGADWPDGTGWPAGVRPKGNGVVDGLEWLPRTTLVFIRHCLGCESVFFPRFLPPPLHAIHHSRVSHPRLLSHTDQHSRSYTPQSLALPTYQPHTHAPAAVPSLAQ